MPRSHPHTVLVWSREPAVFFFISIMSKKKLWLARETILTQGKWYGEPSQPSWGSTHVDD